MSHQVVDAGLIPCKCRIGHDHNAARTMIYGPIPSEIRIGDCAMCPRDDACPRWQGRLCPHPAAYYTGAKR